MRYRPEVIWKQEIKVLIIDHSKSIRQTLEKILKSDHEIAMVVAASEPVIAELSIKTQYPDVIIMDLETPRLDGVKFLQKLLNYYSIPVIICSRVINKSFETSYNKQNKKGMKIIQKPKINVTQYLEETKTNIRAMVKEVARL